MKDGKAADATRQPEQVKAFRDTWELGIHSYLSYLRDRLMVARELLTESGSCFVQIGDENVHLVRSLMDEVFGSENSVVTIVFRTTSNLFGDQLGRNSDFLLWYAKDLQRIRSRKLYRSQGLQEDIGNRYTRVELADGRRRGMSQEERRNAANLPLNSRAYRHDNLTSTGATSSGTVRFDFDGQTFFRKQPSLEDQRRRSHKARPRSPVGGAHE